MLKCAENKIVEACSWVIRLAWLWRAVLLGNNQQLRNECELAERLIRNERDIIREALQKAFKGTSYEGEVMFNNQSPMNVVNDLAAITTLLEKKDIIGEAAVYELLMMMGMDEEQAKTIVTNDSE